MKRQQGEYAKLVKHVSVTPDEFRQDTAAPKKRRETLSMTSTRASGKDSTEPKRPR